MQTCSVEAGAPIELLRRAGVELPELTKNYRQRSERDRQTAALWREGRALEALTRLQEDKGCTWKKAGRPRSPRLPRWRALTPWSSLPAPDKFVLRVTDRAGQFEMPIAVGDRVRFFARVGDGRQVIANNGDIACVLNIDATGMVVQNERTGTEGRVTYDRLRDQDTGEIKLGTGEAVTIHTSQGATLDQAVFVLPNGTTGLDSGRAYTASSRHRDKIQIVANESAEREAIGRHQIGDRSRVSREDVIKHMAVNLGRQDKTEIATVLMERVGWQRTLERRASVQALETSRGRDGPDIGM
jgi:AAA domain/Viral (Superfamily 1) RNA helicase